MILEQVPSKSKRHFSRNHFSHFESQTAVSVADDRPTNLTRLHSKLLLINKALQNIRIYDDFDLNTFYIPMFLLIIWLTRGRFYINIDGYATTCHNSS